MLIAGHESGIVTPETQDPFDGLRMF